MWQRSCGGFLSKSLLPKFDSVSRIGRELFLPTLAIDGMVWVGAFLCVALKDDAMYMIIQHESTRYYANTAYELHEIPTTRNKQSPGLYLNLNAWPSRRGTSRPAHCQRRA